MSSKRARLDCNQSKDMQVYQVVCVDADQLETDGNEIWIKEEPASNDSPCRKTKKGRREKPYTCNICDKSFSTEEKCQAHYLTHSVYAEPLPNSFRIVYQTEDVDAQLVDDSSKDLQVIELECIGGNESMSMQPTSSKQPKNISIQEEAFTCDVCKKSFNTEDKCQAHYLTHSVYAEAIPNSYRIIYQTEDADVQLADASSKDLQVIELECIEEHENMSTQQTEVWIKEEPSPDSPNCAKDMKDRCNRDGVVKTITCEVCEKSFASEEKFQEHYLIHSGVKPFVCDVCLKGFANKSNLQRHRLIHSAEKPYVCEVCHKSFADKYTFQMHKMIHSGEKHVCDICHREFTQKSNLKRHYSNHSAFRPHGCNLCGKCFTDKYTLETHLAIHTGEKFICDICFQGFTQKSNLKRHYNLHFANKPYGCDVCGKSYADNYTLQIHRLIHTGEKHVCEICSRGFTQKSNLKRHLSTHNKEKNYHYCLKCPKKFLREDKLEKHELTHLKSMCFG